MTTAKKLGSELFREHYSVDYSYAVGGMYGGISSVPMTIRLANAKMLGYLSSGSIPPKTLEKQILEIKRHTNNTFGVSIPCYATNPDFEDLIFSILIKHNVEAIEASGYLWITPGLVQYRLKGLKRGTNGKTIVKHKVMAKLALTRLTRNFLAPPPRSIVDALLEQGKITQEEACLAQEISIADDISVEADSGGHTTRGNSLVILPEVLKIRDEFQMSGTISNDVRIGLGGGIGTPHATASAFMLGADFVMTGSINQCTVEAGISGLAKDILEQVQVGDTGYVSSDDFSNKHFIQVVTKRVLFQKRAIHLEHLFNAFNSIDSIDANTIEKLEKNYFSRSIHEVYSDVKGSFSAVQINEAEINPKKKLLLIFKMYYRYSWEYAIQGVVNELSNFQICSGSSLGAFNSWINETAKAWKNRHVDEIGQMIMQEAGSRVSGFSRKFLNI